MMQSLASPLPKEKRAVTGALIRRKKLTRQSYHQASILQCGAFAQWEREAERLMAEYSRTGDPRHLTAHGRHCLAMVRMYGKAVR